MSFDLENEMSCTRIAL